MTRTTTEDRPTGRTRAAMMEGVPLVERRMDVAGITTALYTGGEGPPVVLLHGPGEFAALWSRVVPGLATAHHVIVPDLPGHGATGVPDDGPLAADRYLAWLSDLIDRTCAQPPTLVGHLAGGALALRHALSGGPVDRLVLVDSAGLSWNRTSPSFGVPLAGFLVRPTERSRDRMLGRCMYDFDRMRTDVGPRWQPCADYLLDRVRAPGGRAAVLSLASAFGLAPISRRRLAGLQVPTTLIWGRHDLQTPLSVAERATRRYGWPLHVVEEARDDPCWEQPEASLAALRAAFATTARS